jgi:hypothetical protein
MAASEAVLGKPEPEASGLRQVVVSNLQQFCDECDQFIKRQYREIIRGNPSSEHQDHHRRELQWALRTAKLLECVAADPDSSSSSAVKLLRSKIWQLERSWKMLYDPMPEEEADRILTEVFPDEPRA